MILYDIAMQQSGILLVRTYEVDSDNAKKKNISVVMEKVVVMVIILDKITFSNTTWLVV